jgi:glyoxylase-like metal-dependent hydrolase (beta-lactamase superfamily II)
MSPAFYSIEGNAQRLDGGSMYGNVPRALWERWSIPDDRHRIRLATRALLVVETDRKVLLEAGIGAFFDPKYRDRFGVEGTSNQLIASIAEHGFSPEDIDVVVCSHLHFDHVGGLLTDWSEETEPALVFPNASFVVGERAWQRAENPHARDRASFIPALQALLRDCGRLELVQGNRSATLGDAYCFHYSDGHTPGLMLTEVATEIGPILFTADLIPGRPWVHLPITMGYDRFPERLIDEKRTLLEDLVARNGHLFFTHDPECALATLTRDDRGRFTTIDPIARLDGALRGY